jgi:hypothetical protein
MKRNATLCLKLLVGAALFAAAVFVGVGEARADFTSSNYVNLTAFQNTLTPYPQFDVSSGSGSVDFQYYKTGHYFTITHTASGDLTAYQGSSGHSNGMIGGYFDINIEAWENGSTWTVGHGSASNDLTVYATGFSGSNPPPYSGTLLTGTLKDFEINEVSETGAGTPNDFLEFYFKVTGGSMATVFGGDGTTVGIFFNTAGAYVNLAFDGNNFSSTAEQLDGASFLAQENLTAPLPPSLLMFMSGLIGLGALGRFRRARI